MLPPQTDTAVILYDPVLTFGVGHGPTQITAEMVQQSGKQTR
jgi:hypothetical protein